MSTVVSSKGHRHRHTQSDASPSRPASSKNPQNPHHLNAQSYMQNSQSEMSDSYQSNPTTPPRTPRSNDQPSQNRTATDNGSKQKSRNKNRPKNVMTSPAVTRKGRNTPPLTGARSGGIPLSAKPMSTPSTTAYAGTTFHASPAPSALPIPSFYSKSIPDSPGMKSFKAKDASLSDPPTPPVLASNNRSQQTLQVQREESPLDFFFKAHREEKARAKSASSSQNAATLNGPFSPPYQSLRVSQTPPATAIQNHAGHSSKAYSSAIFAMEMDGEVSAGSPMGPAFSTPYAERINAARFHQQPSQEAQRALDRSEVLKAYLFSGHLPSSTPTTNPFAANSAPAKAQNSPAASPTSTIPGQHLQSTGFSQRSHQNTLPFQYDQTPPTHAPRPSGRTSGLRQEVTPTKTPTKTPDRSTGCSTSPTPSRTFGNANSSDKNDFIGNIKPQASFHGVSSGDMSTDIKGMEDSLRKILKLDSGVTGQIGSVPAAASSVPNYVGGRPPPLT